MAQTPEERRVVTILAADLVGSTALIEKLDPEEAKLITGEALRQVIRLVERYGGHVKDIAGDGVLALFGAPTAHEDDPERAVRTGLEITAALEKYAADVQRGWGIEGFSVRVGIDTGAVVVGQVGASGRVEYGAVGDAVNTAARLQAAAEPGDVLVGSQVRRLAGDVFDWGPTQSLTLKGKAGPVEAYRVLGVGAGVAVAVPAAAAQSLVGRARERESIGSLVEALSQGRGAILAITGEPGVGKTRLVEELHRLLPNVPGTTWLEGRCVSYGEGLAYWPYRDLLRDWLAVGLQAPEVRVRIALKRRLNEVLGDDGEDRYPYLSAVLGLKPDSDATAISPESVQYRTFEVFQELVDRMCGEGPVVLFLEDLHWSDPTSLALTEKLVPLVETSRLLLVFTMRPESRSAAWAFKERLSRDYSHAFTELALAPLLADEGIDLVTQMSGGAVSERISARLVDYAGGNPFYLEEIVRASMERGELAAADGRPPRVPESVEGVIMARIDSLEPAWREVATSASVLGRRFNLPLLGAVTGKSDAELRETLHHLLRVALLQDEGGPGGRAYRFKHALIQETAYKTLVSARRTTLHRRAAEWLEGFYADRPERVYGLIAHHWKLAEDRAKAAHYARLAGDQAMSEWSLDEAVDYYRDLLGQLAGLEKRADAAETFFRLATTLHLAMRFREASEAWAEGVKRWQRPTTESNPATAVLRIGAAVIPWSTDRDMGYYVINSFLLQQLNGRLLDERPGPYLVPGMAETWWASDDGLRYRVRLRPGLGWNRSGPLVAEDVVRASRRMLDPEHPSLNSSMLLYLEGAAERLQGLVTEEALGVRAVGELDVEYRLTRPSPYFIFNLAIPEMSAASADGSASGPFEVTSMAEDRVVVTRVPGRAAPAGGNVRQVEWVRYRDLAAARSGAAANEIDVISTGAMPPGSPEDVGMVLAQSSPNLTAFICFPGDEHLVVDRDLRRALALAVDRDGLGPILGRSRMILARGGLVPPGVPGHTPDIVLEQDISEARAALDRSSHHGTLRLVAAEEQSWEGIDELVHGWREHLDLDVEVVRRPLRTGEEWAHQFQLASWAWMADVPDPEYFIRNLLHSASSQRIGHMSCPELDELVDRALLERDGARRLALFHAADRLAVRDEALVIPIGYRGAQTWLKTWVHGWHLWGSPKQSFDELTVDETSPRFSALERD